MDLKRLFNRGKKVVDERGGADSLKADAEELKGIAKSEGSITDKAKDAAAAIKDPGAPGGEDGAASPGGKPHPDPEQAKGPQPPQGP
jgi:hypothetical protein